MYLGDRPGNTVQTQIWLGLHCLPLIQQFLYTWTDSRLDLPKFKFKDKYGYELGIPIFR